MTDDCCLDLLPEYLLGQLPEETRLRVRAHLDSGCSRCNQELRELEESFHWMAYAAGEQTPAASAKARIRAAIDAEQSYESERESGTQSISHYRLLRRIGIGGMGEVFLAEDTRLGRSTALKIIRPEVATNVERKKRFLREARAAAVLNHPGIAVIYEVGEAEGTDFIAMEYVEGQTLAHIIEGKPLDTARILTLGIQMASALSAAHQRGILHRDLKPENIQIGPNDQVKILDFGLAKFTQTRLEDDYTTTSDRILGTIPYMSPEQIESQGMDARSDLFSLGSILYEMATGKAPFTGNTPAETLQNILNKNPQPVAQLRHGISPGLERIIERCLEKFPEDRYASAKELEEELTALQRGETVDIWRTPGKSGARAGISIAVLYFENLSEERESDYFRAGMTEDIITELSKIRSWEVRPRTQVLKYTDQEIDVKEVGQDLRVTHVMQGSIRKAGPRLRISAQLVDARSAASVWGERYDRDLKDVFEIQEEIAQRIAAALRVHLTGDEKREIARRPTENMEAYDFYLRGREMIFRLSKDGVRAAIEYFTQAIGQDPNYALAYAGLAQAYAIQLSFYGGPDSQVDVSIDTARKALDIDPSLAQAYAALGLAYLLKKMANEAIEACAKAIELNPYDAFATWISGRLYYRMNQYEEAANRFKRTIELLPDFYTAYSDLAQAYENMDLKDHVIDLSRQAVDACRRYLASYPGEARAHIFLASSSARLGNRDEAISQGLIAVGLSPDDPVMMYNMACLYSVLNEQDSAVQWLKKSIQHGRGDFEWIKRDPSFDNIRNHPGYIALLSESGPK